MAPKKVIRGPQRAPAHSVESKFKLATASDDSAAAREPHCLVAPTCQKKKDGGGGDDEAQIQDLIERQKMVVEVLRTPERHSRALRSSPCRPLCFVRVQSVRPNAWGCPMRSGDLCLAHPWKLSQCDGEMTLIQP